MAKDKFQSSELVDAAMLLRKREAEVQAARSELLNQCNEIQAPLIIALLGQSVEPNIIRAEILKSVGDVAAANENVRKKFLRYGLLTAIGITGAFVLAALAELLIFSDKSPLGTVGDILSAIIGTGGLVMTVFLVILLVSISILGMLTDFSALWKNIQLVLESGVFYFFAGLLMILSALHMSDSQEHPSLTFIFAMLGVAILLFGTGSQATGSLATFGAPLRDSPAKPIEAAAAGDAPINPEVTPKKLPTGDWGPFKANAVIAGGAAVLTAIFAYGVIIFREDIPVVFANYNHYVRILIKPCASMSSFCSDADVENISMREDFSFNNYRVSATNEEGTPLFVRKHDNALEILTFPDELRGSDFVNLKIQYVGGTPKLDDLNTNPTARIPVYADILGSDGESLKECAEWVDPKAHSSCKLKPLGSKSGGNREERIARISYSLNIAKLDQTAAIDNTIVPVPDEQTTKTTPVTIELQ